MKVDMSPEAVTARIKLVAELHYLHLSLSKAGPKQESTTESVREPREGYGKDHGPKAS
jgi:hypothetical protein